VYVPGNIKHRKENQKNDCNWCKQSLQHGKVDRTYGKEESKAELDLDFFLFFGGGRDGKPYSIGRCFLCFRGFPRTGQGAKRSYNHQFRRLPGCRFILFSVKSFVILIGQQKKVLLYAIPRNLIMKFCIPPPACSFDKFMVTKKKKKKRPFLFGIESV